MMNTMCGTPSYLAPEIFCNPRDAVYDKSVDIWALGVVLYALNTGEFPFPRMNLGDKKENEKFKSSQLAITNPVFNSLSPSCTNDYTT
ncbi:Serine/threonine-protein kinase 33 [Smittium culicis]|uniref:Serine/threonine-protein kinase 33 n=1 Tax=Smittium culicis TaxID=133412 RepID=A0A1R1YSP9_9FUNG|nr:Serine/threonine-protein kinase 33 [Smittium culicis]